MRDDSFLPAELRARLRELGEVDVLVGVPSFNNARTIGQVIRAIHAGLAKYFPDQRVLVLNSDGGSRDRTEEVATAAGIGDYRTVFARHPLHALNRIFTPYHGIAGKGSALRTVFAAASLLGCKACVVVDADLRSITPEWMDLLVSPVLKEGFDFVAPLYRRHKYDGTITNSIVYPLTRALYGLQVRQPIGGDFGFSGRLAAHYVDHDVWHSDVARFGIDIWMTTTAITGGFKVCQSFLGAKIHDAKDPAVDLTAMLSQVVGSVFSLMETHAPVWRQVRGSRAVPMFGFEHAVGLEPVTVDAERMLSVFRTGVRDLAPIWAQILPPETLETVQTLARRGMNRAGFPAELWAQVVYDFAAAYHRAALHRGHLLASLIPLYLGRTAAFVRETAEASADEVETRLEALCAVFESSKDYLIERWESRPGGPT